tara:strand:- start:182 stop:397 length:216 start_codon:yes stop_codon:yes gene_type:complete
MEGKKAILSIKERNEISIYNYIDMEGIRKYLIYYPHLLAILEFLMLHINDYVKEQNAKRKYNKDISQSSHI